MDFLREVSETWLGPKSLLGDLLAVCTLSCGEVLSTDRPPGSLSSTYLSSHPPKPPRFTPLKEMVSQQQHEQPVEQKVLIQWKTGISSALSLCSPVLDGARGM